MATAIDSFRFRVGLFGRLVLQRGYRVADTIPGEFYIEWRDATVGDLKAYYATTKEGAQP